MSSSDETNSAAGRKPLVIWQFSDGKLGHLRQSDALIEGFEKLFPVRLHRIPPLRGKLPAPGRIRRLLREAREKCPQPQLLIGTGHSTHLPLLYAKSRTGARAVVLMKPSLPLSWFDAAVIPQHDGPPNRSHVIASRGALAPARKENNTDPGQGLIMVGGPSRYFRWDPGLIERQIDFIVKRMQDVSWTVTDSPRTPGDLRVAAQPNCRFSSWTLQPKGWLGGQLARAGIVWVTLDSASMLSDALGTSAEVNLLELPVRRRNNKLLSHTRQLGQQSEVLGFGDWIGRPLQARQRNPLHDQFRCARLLLELLGLMHR